MPAMRATVTTASRVRSTACACELRHALLCEFHVDSAFAAIDKRCLVRTAADPMPLPLPLMVNRPFFSGAAVAGRRRARSSGVQLGKLLAAFMNR